MASADDFDPYRVLGIERDASASEVAQAYRSGAKRSHPDLHGPDAARRMHDLNRAFHILSDTEQRCAWEAAHPAAEPRNPHWSPASHHRARPGTPGGPASWAEWEADRPRPVSGPVRVMATERWPRPARPVAPPARGLRDSAWLAVGAALLLLVALLFLGWLASTTRIPASARQATAAIGLTSVNDLPLDPDHQLSVFSGTSGLLGLVAVERVADGWEAQVLTQVATTHPLSVILYQDAESPTGVFASIVFGRAEGGVSRVRLVGIDGQGGDVTNGTWSVVLPHPIGMEDLEWEFVLVDGSVLRGSGELGM